MKKITGSFLLVILSICVIAQENDLCQASTPVCANSIFSFQASTGGFAQAGPFYGCLSAQPNPSWFYFKVAVPGEIIITMSSQQQNDIDFICWGPFDEPHACCDGGLTAERVVSCSFSTSPVETCTLADAVKDKYYVLLITNFSNEACSIVLHQTGGNGATDCCILPSAVSSNSPLCEGEALHLFADSIPGADYYWTGPNGFTSTDRNPVIPGSSLPLSGVYQCVISALNTSDTFLVDAKVNGRPEAQFSHTGGTAGNVCHFTDLSVIGEGSIASWQWDFGDGQGTSAMQHPMYTYPHPGTFDVRLITVSGSGCSDTAWRSVCIVSEFTVTAQANPALVCVGSSSQLTALPAEGSGDYHFYWTSEPPGFESDKQDPTVEVQQRTAFIIEVDDGFERVYDTIVVDVMPLPVAEAGFDLDVHYGTSITLDGQVAGGTAPYSFEWQPGHLLIDPRMEDPRTVPMTNPVEFTMNVYDINGCSNSDKVMVHVNGEPLTASISGSFIEPVCPGEPVILAAMGSGGTGHYQYAWRDETGTVISSEISIRLEPMDSFLCSLEITDGLTSAVVDTEIRVHEAPAVNLIPAGYQGTSGDTVTVCVYDHLVIHAGDPALQYRWFDGSTGPELVLNTTGIGIDGQTVWLEVTHPGTGCVLVDSIYIEYDFAACVGVGESRAGKPIRIFPNPVHDRLIVEYEEIHDPLQFILTSLSGQVLYQDYLPGYQQGTGEYQLDLRFLPRGFYLLKLVSRDQCHVEKIILN